MEIGRLELIFGPMFSGKSTALLREAQRKLSVIKDSSKILLVNSKKDSRCDNEIMTHDKVKIPAIKVENLFDLSDNSSYSQCQILLIDEAQFFTDLYEFVRTICLPDKKHIIVCGLDGNSNQMEFGQILKLIPLADKVTKLTALCKLCADGNTEAPFTRRIISSTSEILVGSHESYISVCRAHLGASAPTATRGLRPLDPQ
jgi:thymidine kinase